MTLRNDLDDEPRRPARERKGGMPRWVPFAVVGIAAIGFGGLVGYGYWAFSDGQGRIAVPLVTAGQPYLEKPANPGGMEVAHGDLRIWNVGKNGASPAPKPESFVPPPETPLPRPAPAAPPPAPAPAAAQPGAAAGAAPAPAQAAPAEQPLQVDTRPPPGPIPKPPPPAPPVRAVAVVPGAAAALPPPARAGSPAGARIQLGSVRSEADARKLWDSVRRKHPGEVGALTAHISRVDFPDRGTFYRVNAGTLPDRDAARDMCAKLRKAGTECIVAAPN
ncbi:MAG: SPOR domain-containing protein [Alphaproteobacteria bacterium]